MTPQLQQAIRLLAMSNAELGDFVEAEIEKNPLLRLEEGEGPAEGPASPAPPEGPRATDRTVEDHALMEQTFDSGAENLVDPSPSDGPSPFSLPADRGTTRSFGGKETISARCWRRRSACAKA